jgi:hypothetical protein
MLLASLLLPPLLLGKSDQDCHYIWVFFRTLWLNRPQPSITSVGNRRVKWLRGWTVDLLPSKGLYFIKCDIGKNWAGGVAGEHALCPSLCGRLATEKER